MSGMSSRYKSKQLYSSNYILDRIIKQKLDELEKVKSQNTRTETAMKAKDKNDVIINMYS